MSAVSQGGPPLPSILGGLKPSQHGLCHASHDAPCQAGLVLGFVVSFHIQSWGFFPSRPILGRRKILRQHERKHWRWGPRR